MNVLTHQALGHTWQRTRIAIAFLFFLSVSLLIHWTLAVYGFRGERGHTIAPIVDVFFGILILLVAISGPLALAYAALNGGPLLAAALPTIPYVLATLLRGPVLVTPDLTFILACSATATWVGLWHTAGVQISLSDLVVVTIGSTLTVLTIFLGYRGIEEAHPLTDPPYFVSLLVLTLGIFFAKIALTSFVSVND